MNRLPIAAGLALFAFAGCFFSFERGDDLGPGEIEGRAVFAPGTPAPYTRITPLGTPRVRTSASDGTFRLDSLAPGTWALRFTHDEDGDGKPERAATRVVQLRGSGDETAGLLVGDVTLEPVASLRGVVVRSGTPVPGARVVAFGPAELADLEVELPVEATTATDENGEFRFPALASGQLLIAAYTDDAAASPISIALVPGEARVGLTIRLLADPAPRNVQIELAPPAETDELVSIDLVPAGSAAPDVDPAQIDPAAPNVRLGAGSIGLNIEVGEWDVYATTSRGRRGALLGQVVLPPGNPALTWGLMLLSLDDPCAFLDEAGAVLDGRDCDRDRLQGLPEDVAIFTECAPACADAFGAANGAESCDTSAGTFDCDDDGDGQPDVTVPLACYGIERGGDRDGDRVCDREDTFPDCAENDPAAAACGADRPDVYVPPPVPPEFIGPPVVDGGPDPDAGPDELPVSFDVARLDFGPITERLAEDRAVVLTNNGASALNVELTTASLDFEVLPPVTASLAPGVAQSFTVRFRPLAAGTFADNLVIVHDGGDLVAPTLPLGGESSANTGAPLLRASRTSLDFSSVVVGTRAVVSVTLENIGAGVALVQDVEGLGAEIEVLTQLPLAVENGRAAALALAFEPQALGPIERTLRLVGDLGAEVIVAATGTGIETPVFSPLDAPVALRLPAGGNNGENIIAAATVNAASFEVDLPATAIVGDRVVLRLLDRAGGVALIAPAIVAPGTQTLSIDASALVDGPVFVEARIERGVAPDVIASEALSLDIAKSAGALASPTLDDIVPELTANDRVTISGLVPPLTAGPGARVFVTGGAFEASAPLNGGVVDEAFSLQVTLRRNTQNLLTTCYTDGTDTACAAPLSVVHLVPDELVIAEAESRPLTTAEVETLVEAGVVSLDDPDNFHVDEFTVVLEVGGEQIAITQPVVLPNDTSPGVYVGSGSGSGGGGGGGALPSGGGGCCGGGGSSTTIVVVQPPGGVPPIPGVIVIDGAIKSLKELFQITLALSNTSDVLALDDVAAQLALPAGLTAIRAGLGVDVGDVEVDGPIDDVVIGTVDPGTTGAAQFIVRGDVAGDYEVRIDFAGIVTGPGLSQPVPFDGGAFTGLTVFGAPTFDIKLVHPNAVTNGEDYDLRIDVKNTAPIPARYTSLALGLGSGAVPGPAGLCPVVDPSVVDLDLGHLEPGQTASRTVRLTACLTGDITGCQVRSSENLNVQVVTGAPCPADTNDVPFELPDGFDPPGVLALDPLPNRTLDGATLTEVSVTLSGEVANTRADEFTDATDGGGGVLADATFSAPGTVFVERLELGSATVIERVPMTLSTAYDAGNDQTLATLRFEFDGLTVPLVPDARYRVTVRGGADGVRNINSGLPLASNFTWVFFTEIVDDGQAPAVAATFPLDNEDDATPGTTVAVAFSERIDPTSVSLGTGANYNSGTFAVVQGATVNLVADLTGGTGRTGSLSLSADGKTVSFTANPPLQAGATFHIRVAGIRDVFGTLISGIVISAFDTGAADGVPPPAPTVDPVVRFTAAASTLVQGRTEPYAGVEVAGGAQTVSGNANALGRFGLLIPLSVSVDHSLSVTATDLNGNRGATQSQDTAGADIVTARDLTPPALNITAPAQSTTVVGRAVTIDYSTTDPFGPGVDRVQLTFEGRLLDEAFDAVGQLTFNSEELDNGLRALQLWARDATGNWGGPFVLSVDVQNPALPRVDAVVVNAFEPGKTTRLVISGDNVETATAVSFDAGEITATVAGTSGFDLLVDATVPFDFAPAAVVLTVTNVFGAGSTADTAVPLFVRAPAMSMPALAVSRPHAGDQDRTLQVSGATGFLPSTEVLIDGIPASTTVADGSALAFTVPAALMNTAGAHSIAARSPDPVLSFRNSNTRAFTVVVPTLSFTESAISLVETDVRTVTVSSDEAAEVGGLDVDVDVADAAVASLSDLQVSIPAGQSAVTVDINALVAGATTVTASAPFTNSGELSLAVIGAPVPTFARQDHPTLPLLDRTYAISIDRAAPTDGVDVTLAIAGGLASTAATVSFAAGETDKNFTLTGVSLGDDTINASTIYSTSAQANVLVREAVGESDPAPIRAAALNNRVFIDVATDGTNPVTAVEIEIPDLWSAVNASLVTADVDGVDVSASVTRGAIGAGTNGGTRYTFDLAATPIDPGLATPQLAVTFDGAQAFEVLGPSEWLVRVDKGAGIVDATRETFILVDGTAADGAGVATVTTNPEPLPAATTGATVTLDLVNNVEIVTDAAALFADFSQQGANLNWFLENNATFGDLVRTNVNGAPGYFVSPDSLSDGVIDLEIAALTTGDDDYIGVVFRWQDPCNFYLLDWKQLNQAPATVGKTLRRIEDCDFDGDGVGGENITANTLFNNTHPNVVAAERSGGWLDNTFHSLKVILAGARIQVIIDDAPVIDFTDPAPYLDGGYGPYSNSQANTAIRNVRVSRASTLIDTVEVELPVELGAPAAAVDIDAVDRTGDLIFGTGPGGGALITLPAAGLLPGVGAYQLILTGVTAPAAGSYDLLVRTAGASGNLEPLPTTPVLVVIP